MNFTREPIIETIITPREGSRLLVRSSKQGTQEEFAVDAVEVVSFGQSLFYRSLERPRPFLVPVGDYEVVEVKESRVVLKNAQYEKTIKIGGGREASFRKEEDEQALPLALEDEVMDETPQQQPSQNRKRDRHRRRRRSHEERSEMKQRVEEPPKEGEAQTPKTEPALPPSFSHLIPPPTSLISDTIHRYKEQQQEPEKPASAPEPTPPQIIEDDSNSISRVATPESQPTTTNFSALNNWNNFLP